MNGAELIQKGLDAGYPEDELRAWEAKTREQGVAAGYSYEEIDAYFGKKPIDTEPIRAHFRQAMEEASGSGEAGERKEIGLFEAYSRGWGQSVPGLLYYKGISGEGKSRETIPEDADWERRLMSNLGVLTGDFPLMVTGALMGAAAGGGIFSAATGFGGAFALPAGIRRVLMESYENGQIETWDQFLEVTGAAVTDEFKAWTVGFATGGAGKTVGLVAKPLSLPTEVASMATLNSAMEGQWPDAKDYLDTGVLIFGLRAATKTAGKLREVTKRVGKRPAEVAEDAAADPSIAEDLVSKNQDIPRAYRETQETETKPVVEPEAKPAPEVIPTDRVSVTARNLAERDEHAPTESVSVGGKIIAKTKGESPEQTLQRMSKAASIETLNVESEVSSAVSELMNSKVSGRNKAGTPGRTFAEMSGSAQEHIAAVEAKAAKDIEALSKKVKMEGSVDVDIEGKVATEVGAIADRAAARIREIMEEGREEREPASKKEESRADRAVDAFREKLMASTADLVEKAEARQLVEDAAKNAATTGRSVSDVLEGMLSRRALVIQAGRPTKGDTPEDRILGRISIGGKDPKPGWSIHDFYTDWFDRLHPLSRAVNAMKEGQELPIVEDAYKLARLHVGVAGKATHFLEYSPIEFGTFERVGKPLKELLEPVAGKTLDKTGEKTDLDLFRTYAVAKRAIEMDRRGTKEVGGETEPLVKTGIDINDAHKVVEKYSEKLDPVLADLKEYQTHTLNYLRDSGLLSKEAYKAMREANEDYVPFFRRMEEGQKGGAGKGMKTRMPIFKIKGSEREIIDPIESVIKNTYLYISLAERNEIGVAFTDLIQKTGNTEYGVKAKPKMHKTLLDEKEKSRLLKAYAEKKGEKLSDLDQKALEEVLQEEFAIFRQDALKPGKNQIAVYRDGKREVWDVDPDVAETFGAGDAASARKLSKFLQVPAKMLRVGAIWTPEFIGRNPFRDQVSAFIFSEAGYRPFLDFAKGIFNLASTTKTAGRAGIEPSQLYQEWLISGGPMATMVSLDRTYLQKSVRDVMGQTGLMEKARNAVTSPINALAVVSEMSSGTRLGEFGRARAGKPRTKEEILESGFKSREVTLDFGRMGAKGAAVNRYVAFFNANLQGTDKVVRSFKAHPARTSARIAASVTIPAVTMHLINRDKEWYKDAPRWQRDLFMLGGVGGTEDNPEWVARLPKAFEVGIIFGTGAERIVDFILDRDANAFDGFLSSVYHSMTPSIVPQAVLPGIETFANRSLYMDRSIIPRNREGWLPDTQYAPYTTELTKAMAKAIAQLPVVGETRAASPAIIDNWIRGWTGGLGNHLLKLADASLRKTGVLPDPPRPDDTLADMVFIKAFVMRYPSADSESLQDFYDGYHKTERIRRTIRGLARQGEPRAAFELLKMRGGELVGVEGAYKSLSGLSRLMRLISISQSIPSSEKQQIIDRYQFVRIAIAKRANKQIERARQIAEERKRDEQ